VNTVCEKHLEIPEDGLLNTYKYYYRSLYRHLPGIAKIDEYKNFRAKYYTLDFALQMAYQILPYVVINNNHSYTLHDFSHSVRVILNINKIIDLLLHENPDEVLNETELKLLYFAAWYHDVGMAMFSRHKEENIKQKHGDISCVFLKDYIKNLKQTPDTLQFDIEEYLIDPLCKVIKSHSSFAPKNYRKIKIQNHIVQMKQICSIFCLADVLDVGIERAPRTAHQMLTNKKLMIKLADLTGGHSYPYLDKKSKEHWDMNRTTNFEINVKQNTIFLMCGNEDGKRHYHDKIIFIKKLVSWLFPSVRVVDLP